MAGASVTKRLDLHRSYAIPEGRRATAELNILAFHDSTFFQNRKTNSHSTLRAVLIQRTKGLKEDVCPAAWRELL